MRTKLLIVLSLLLAASCSNTKVTKSWLEKEYDKPFKHPMVIGISDSQQTRQIFEKHFVSELSKNDISATPSYKLISSKQKMNRETVVDAIDGTAIDSVIITYLVSSEAEVRHHDSPVNPGYSNEADNKVSATIIATRGRTSNTEIFTLKNDLYSVEDKALIWTVQTRTVAPESIDEVVTDVVALLIDQLLDDGVLK